ncbi:MAG: universal stress protein [Rhizobiales bacterium]|nr:universal stress protein [Hyphomicrobiales bacterium]MBI3673650.1 universal stress protein [Hyphomicrobiales bacterium]
MRHFMLATDGSESADRALKVAAELAKGSGKELMIVTVARTMVDEATSELVRIEGSVGDLIEAHANQILAAARDSARRLGASSVRVATLWGDASEAIIETAGKEGADMIVVGRRGRGRLAGLLLGSVSQKLVALAPCSVVVVP